MEKLCFVRGWTGMGRALRFDHPPHVVRTHKFSNPLFRWFGIRCCCCYYFRTFYVHPHVPSILFSLPCAARRARLPVLVRNGRKRKNSRYSRTCIGSVVGGAARNSSPCRKYNQFRSLSTHTGRPPTTATRTKISSNFSLFGKWKFCNFVVSCGVCVFGCLCVGSRSFPKN